LDIEDGTYEHDEESRLLQIDAMIQRY